MKNSDRKADIIFSIYFNQQDSIISYLKYVNADQKHSNGKVNMKNIEETFYKISYVNYILNIINLFCKYIM